MTVRLVNLCRKPIKIICQDGIEVTLPAAVSPARVISSRASDTLTVLADGDLSITYDVEIVYSQTRGTANVPDPVEGVYYVVPSAVANALPERSDLLVTGLLARDERGQIASASALVSIYQHNKQKNGA